MGCVGFELGVRGYKGEPGQVYIYIYMGAVQGTTSWEGGNIFAQLRRQKCRYNVRLHDIYRYRALYRFGWSWPVIGLGGAVVIFKAGDFAAVSAKKALACARGLDYNRYGLTGSHRCHIQHARIHLPAVFLQRPEKVKSGGILKIKLIENLN